MASSIDSATAVQSSAPDQASKRTAAGRLTDIEWAKGLGILLVVLGHIVARSPPAGSEWYVQFKYMVYLFHMPFFMYLNGVGMFYSGRSFGLSKAGYAKYIQQRAVRLLVPFILFGVLILVGKLVAAMILPVDNPPQDFWDGLAALFWHTYYSPATSVWYVYVIFVYSAIVPPLFALVGRRIWVLLAIGAAIYFLPYPDILYVDKIGHNFVFFVLGGLAATYLDAYRALLDRWGLLVVGLFGASFLIVATDMTLFERMFVVGICSLPALHALMRMPFFASMPVFPFLARNLLAIYLLNTIAIGLTKGILLKFMPWDGYNFLLFAPILTAAGIGVPILVKKLFPRVPFWS
jgi:fucose 4-O-acetylase-like acetyltransferase